MNGREEESPEEELFLMTEQKRVEGEAEQEQKNWFQSQPELSAEEKARIGRETGICQFCGRVLTHPESKLRGFGPTCAAKNGLPWSAGSGEAYSNDGVSQSLLAEVGAE